MSFTESEIKKLVDETYDSQEFQNFRKTRKDMDDVRNGAQTIPLPDLYKNQFVPMYYAYEAQHASNIHHQEMRHARPVYSIYSRAIEQERQKGAQSFEHYMNRQLIIWRDIPDSPYDLTSSDQINRGAGMYKLGLRTEAVETDAGRKYVVWGGKPSKDGQITKDWARAVDEYKLRSPTPFVLEAVSILACALFEDADGVAYAVEKSLRPVNAILAAYGWTVKDGKLYQLGAAIPPDYQPDPKTRHVSFIEVCTRDTIFHLLEEPAPRTKADKYKVVGQYPNPFGAVRYVMAPGIVRSESAFGDRYVPLIEPALKVAEDRSYFGTLRKFAAALAALPFMDVVTEAESVLWTNPKTGLPMTIHLDPFKPMEYQLPAGTKLQERYQRVTTEMDRFEGIIQQDLQRYGPSEVLTGGSAGEREPAWALSLRGEKAERGIEPALDGQKKALREIARQVAWCVKNHLKEDVLIWTTVNDEFGRPNRQQVRVRPADIEEDFDIDLDMGYKNTGLQLANRESLRRGKEDGDVSRRRLQEEGYDVTDPVAEDMQIEIERIDRIMSGITLGETVKAATIKFRAERGLPDPSPQELETIQAIALQMSGVKVVEERRPASPVRTPAEAPPTPAGQRIL
jgi:hypothetical protein